MKKEKQHKGNFVLELFTHPRCASRQEAARWLEDVLRDFPNIPFEEVNMLEHVDRAQTAGVKFSPTLVLNGKILCVGIPDKEELVALLRRESRENPHA